MNRLPPAKALLLVVPLLLGTSSPRVASGMSGVGGGGTSGGGGASGASGGGGGGIGGASGGSGSGNGGYAGQIHFTACVACNDTSECAAGGTCYMGHCVKANGMVDLAGSAGAAGAPTSGAGGAVGAVGAAGAGIGGGGGFAGAAGAGGSPGDGGITSFVTPCHADADCGPTGKCAINVCIVPGCRSKAECTAPEVCDDEQFQGSGVGHCILYCTELKGQGGDSGHGGAIGGVGGGAGAVGSAGANGSGSSGSTGSSGAAGSSGASGSSGHGGSQSSGGSGCSVGDEQGGLGTTILFVLLLLGARALFASSAARFARRPLRKWR